MLRKFENNEFKVDYKEDPLYISLGVLYAGRTHQNQPIAIKIACESASTPIQTAYDALVNEIKIVNKITEYMNDKSDTSDKEFFKCLLTHHGYGKITFGEKKYTGLFIEPPVYTLNMILYNDCPQFPWETKYRIAQNITKAACFLHKIDIIHCSLTPNNIYVIKGKKGYKFRLGGMGLAQEKEKDSEYPYRGPLTYKAPEVLEHQRYTEKSDVFSLGILFWELGMEKKIYGGKIADHAKFKTRICAGEREVFPSNFNNNKWKAITAWATEQNPHDRPTAKELLKELTDKNMSEKLTGIAIAKNIIEDPNKREEKKMQLVEAPIVEEGSSSSDVLKDERRRRTCVLAVGKNNNIEMITVRAKKKSKAKKIYGRLFNWTLPHKSTHENENKTSHSPYSHDASSAKKKL